METRDKGAAVADVEQASSRILEIINVKGKATEPGALTMPCSDDDHQEEPYYAYHPWSLYKAPFAELEKGMNRLRTGLPKDGWKITKDGMDGTIGNSPQLVAESEERQVMVDIRLDKEVKSEKAPAMLRVTVQSRCYRVPATPATPEEQPPNMWRP
ncbi:MULTISPECIES: hypothetical protein [unclassified Streptomyces]|uniref:hypothetical protein n=1 Tax=unclassified Streptomyces TaxID=2593676 RepID=UPI002ED0829C|nr:hypothetical protein OH827_07325 [Streptomyces sp. NBC_00891]WSY04846.1 hypothetical protein OG464_07325 [Streptomyces sp. NBC_00890]WSZ06471.1 hypothetical protein OG704_07325 [Streptomyces sp. NBC_00869]WSZ26033.1 hypothetical protein OG498_26240 [Streptomyces sp. NBC_00870]